MKDIQLLPFINDDFEGVALSVVNTGEGAGVTLRRDADLLRAFFPEFPALKVTIQGHCDERGSGEYNLALGARRAWRAAEILKEFGVPQARSETVSFGKEAPQCTDANEACWQKNSWRGSSENNCWQIGIRVGAASSGGTALAPGSHSAL